MAKKKSVAAVEEVEPVELKEEVSAEAPSEVVEAQKVSDYENHPKFHKFKKSTQGEI